MSRDDRSRALLVAVLAPMAVVHTVRPATFDDAVPEWLPGPPVAWHGTAGALEGVAAALLARRATARLGGWLAFAIFLVVWVAHVEDVRLGRFSIAADAPNPTLLAWLRLVAQLPLLRHAWRVAHAEG